MPLRIELGPKDMENHQVVLVRRDKEKQKETVKLDGYKERVGAVLEEMQKELFENAKKERDSRLTHAHTWKEFMDALDRGNLVLAPWCDEIECEEDTKVKSSGKEVVHVSEEEKKEQAEKKKLEAREKKIEQLRNNLRKMQDELDRLEGKEKEKEHHHGEKAEKEKEAEKEEKEKDKEAEKEKDTTGFGLKAAAKTLCKPFNHPELKADAVCFSCGKPAKAWTLWGRSY